MAENTRTREQLENAFRAAVCKILGIPEDDPHKVRFGWGSTPASGSAPAFSRNSNTVVIYLLAGAGGESLTRDLSYALPEGDEKLTYIDEHTSVHLVPFACYGPAAFEWACAIRDGMSLDDVRALLRKESLYYQPGIEAPNPVPELHDGEWWNRYDVRIQFNEGVRIEKRNAVAYAETFSITPVSADPQSFRSLRNKAKELAIGRYSVMSKDALLAAIAEVENRKEEDPDAETTDQ